MHGSLVIGVAVSMLLSSAVGAFSAAPSGSTASGRRPKENNWDASWFTYDRPERVIVEQSTPTRDQIEWTGRPRRMAADDALSETTTPPAPRTIEGIDLVRLRFRDVDGDIVPALLAT